MILDKVELISKFLWVENLILAFVVTDYLYDLVYDLTSSKLCFLPGKIKIVIL